MFDSSTDVMGQKIHQRPKWFLSFRWRCVQTHWLNFVDWKAINWPNDDDQQKNKVITTCRWLFPDFFLRNSRNATFRSHKEKYTHTRAQTFTPLHSHYDKPHKHPKLIEHFICIKHVRFINTSIEKISVNMCTWVSSFNSLQYVCFEYAT